MKDSTGRDTLSRSAAGPPMESGATSDALLLKQMPKKQTGFVLLINQKKKTGFIFFD